MQIDMHYVEAHVSGAHFAQQGVKVCSVIIQKASGIVYQFGYLHNFGFKHTQSIGVCHHDACYFIVKQGLEVFYVDRTVRLGFNFHNFQSGNHSRCRVGAMR